MEMTPERVRALAGQARLALTDEECEYIARDMAHVLTATERLAKLELSDVEPTFHGTTLMDVVRDDVVEPSLPREKLLSAAPDVQDGLVKVPRFMEE